MATEVLDEHRFSSQCSLYEPTRNRLAKDAKCRSTTTSTTTLYATPSTPVTTRTLRGKYSTQSSMPSNPTPNNSIHNRHSTSTDLLSLIRSFAMKPFKTSSMTSAMAEGQTNNVVVGNHIHTKPPVSLLKYRPLSENVTNHTTFTQSTRVCI
jgi:hypothetical protein